MLRWLIKRRIAAFERAYRYDMSAVREILDADLGAFRRFAALQGFARYRRDVPPAAWYAAGITTTLAEDCGPCTQLVVDMAERDGVAPDVLRAILAGDEKTMPADSALGFR